MCVRKFNVTPDNVHQYLPENTRLVVKHLHRGNSPSVSRVIKGGKISPYITKAMLVLENIGPDGQMRKRTIASANAICAPGDNPNRRLSYRIAAGRALRHYWGRRGV